MVYKRVHYLWILPENPTSGSLLRGINPNSEAIRNIARPLGGPTVWIVRMSVIFSPQDRFAPVQSSAFIRFHIQ
jgi:hypothetical protein